MPIPDFQSLMLPVLEFHGDNKEHGSQETLGHLKIKLKLTDAEINELLPSGRQQRFSNRVGWAIIHLMKSVLLKRQSRGKYNITPRGLEVLKEKPEKISIKFLEKFPEYLEFREVRPGITVEKSLPSSEEDRTSTPQELLEAGYQEIRNDLADNLLEQVLHCSPKFFEQMVIDLLINMGYGGSRLDASLAIGQSHDGGVAGIIKEDKLGLDVIYIQAKRWNDATVGSREIRDFIGSLVTKNAVKGIFITTSKFSPDALVAVKGIDRKVVLIDGKELTQLMIDHGIGVTDIVSYTIKRVDFDYFNEE
jgi:restriction system protein